MVRSWMVVLVDKGEGEYEREKEEENNLHDGSRHGWERT